MSVSLEKTEPPGVPAPRDGVRAAFWKGFLWGAAALGLAVLMVLAAWRMADTGRDPALPGGESAGGFTAAARPSAPEASPAPVPASPAPPAPSAASASNGASGSRDGEAGQLLADGYFRTPDADPGAPLDLEEYRWCMRQFVTLENRWWFLPVADDGSRPSYMDAAELFHERCLGRLDDVGRDVTDGLWGPANGLGLIVVREALEDARRYNPGLVPLDSGGRLGPGPSLAPDTREAQGILRFLGFYPGPLDGKAGPATARALASFREAVGVPPGGDLDMRTVILLREAVLMTGLYPVEFVSGLPRSTDAPGPDGRDAAAPAGAEAPRDAEPEEFTLSGRLYRMTSLEMDGLLTVEEYRWCLRQKIRVNVLLAFIPEDGDYGVARSAVGLFSERCGNKKVQPFGIEVWGWEKYETAGIPLVKAALDEARAVNPSLAPSPPDSLPAAALPVGASYDVGPEEARRILEFLGYLDWGGKTGPGFGEALAAFQKDVGLPADGRQDHVSGVALRSSVFNQPWEEFRL